MLYIYSRCFFLQCDHLWYHGLKPIWLVHCSMTSNIETVYCQMTWVGNIAKAMTPNSKQFIVIYAKCWRLLHMIKVCSWRWPDVFTGISVHFSLAWPICFDRYQITQWLIPWDKQWILFPSNQRLRLEENKIQCSPQDQSLM